MLFDQVDIPAQISFMVALVLSQDIDASDKNFYFYRDTNGTGEWFMTPWDLDLTFGPDALNTDRMIANEYVESDCISSTEKLDQVGRVHASHPFLGSRAYTLGTMSKFNPLTDAIMVSPRTREMFLRRLRTMTNELLGSTYYQDRIDELVAMIRDDV